MSGDYKQPTLSQDFPEAPGSPALHVQVCPQKRIGCPLEADLKALPTTGVRGGRKHKAAVFLT